MKTSDGSFHQCFNGQAIVDSETQVIVAAELSDEAPDAEQLEPALEQLDENLDAIGAELPEQAALTADAGYFSEENVRIDHRARARPAHRDRPLQALRAPGTRAQGADSEGRDAQAAHGTQAEDQERSCRLQPAQGDRRAGLRPDANRSRRPPTAATRQARRARPMALPMRHPQPPQAPPQRRTGPDHDRMIRPPGPASAADRLPPSPRPPRPFSQSIKHHRDDPVPHSELPTLRALATHAPRAAPRPSGCGRSGRETRTSAARGHPCARPRRRHPQQAT